VEWIAHRAGNLASTVADAARVADAIELDVHLFRGRLEVRHGKVLWPFARLWEKWELLPVDTPRPPLAEILEVVPADLHVWIDLKGFTRRMARRVMAEVGDRRPITVSARSWWVLRVARGVAEVRTMKSVGNRAQRSAVSVLPRSNDGIVIHERLLDGRWLDRLAGRAPVVIAWGVTDADRARELVDLGVDGLIVDDLSLIAEVAAGS
jgi:glycerophosphoryl diester phosphodiesterase